MVFVRVGLQPASGGHFVPGTFHPDEQNTRKITLSRPLPCHQPQGVPTVPFSIWHLPVTFRLQNLHYATSRMTVHR